MVRWSDPRERCQVKIGFALLSEHTVRDRREEEFPTGAVLVLNTLLVLLVILKKT